MNRLFLSWWVGVWLSLAPALAVAAPAKFWLSASDLAPTGPEAPMTTSVVGGTRLLHVWVQPATIVDGPYHAGGNPFKTLQNISLNLVTFDPAIDFLENTITVHNNPAGAARFEFAGGSATPSLFVDEMPVTPNEAITLQAFNLDLGGGFTGIGPTCGGDFQCSTSGGSPAWLLASVPYQTLSVATAAEVFLQVGFNGIQHQGEPIAQTEVSFGFDPGGPEPIYNAGADRNLNLEDDDADLTVQVFLPPPGDYNLDGAVDAADYTVWRDNLGGPANALPNNLDGGPIGAAHYARWKNNFGTTVSGSLTAGPGAVVPEPASICLILFGLAWAGMRRKAVTTVQSHGFVRCS